MCGGSLAEVHPLGEGPPGYVAILEGQCRGSSPGIVAATFDHPAHSGFSFGVYVPDEVSSCTADINCSGRVGLPDLALLLSSFGLCDNSTLFFPAADFDGSLCVGLEDLVVLLAEFNSECP